MHQTSCSSADRNPLLFGWAIGLQRGGTGRPDSGGKWRLRAARDMTELNCE